jgi:hypothetical protein
VASLAGVAVLAHGGLAGAIIEGFVAVGVVALLVAVWLRERRAGPRSEAPVQLRDEDAP